MEQEYKTLTFQIPLHLYCKLKATAAFRNIRIKTFITEVIYTEIKRLEDERIIPVLDLYDKKIRDNVLQ